MAAKSFIPEPGYEAESLISTAPGAEAGQTIMYVGLADLKRQVRLDAQGLLDEDPVAERHFYFPVDGALQEVSVRSISTNQSGDAYVRTYEVVLGEPLFTFQITLWND